jgi:hypothetical protein
MTNISKGDSSHQRTKKFWEQLQSGDDLYLHDALVLGNGELLQPLENPAPPGGAPPALLRRSLLLFRHLPPPPRLRRGHLRRAHGRDGVRRARAHQAGPQQPQRELLVLLGGGPGLIEPRAPAPAPRARSGGLPVPGRARRVHLGGADDAQAYEAPRRRRRRPGAAARRGRGCRAGAPARRARRRARVRVEHAARQRPPRRHGCVGRGAPVGRTAAEPGRVRGRALGRRAPADAAAAAAGARAAADGARAEAAGGRRRRGAVQRVRAEQRVARGRRGEAEREELAAGEDLVGDAHVGRVLAGQREPAGREYAELKVLGRRR